jgi:sugar (pentulose or hexulose) kinase
MISIESISNKIAYLRKTLLGDISHKEFDDLSEKSPRGAHGLRFNFDENDERLAEGHSRADIARAITESAAALLKDNLAYAEANGLRADRITMVGGMTNSATCVRIIAETLGRDIRVVNGVSAGAVGAAMLAGIGAGIFKNERDAFSKMNFKETLYKGETDDRAER